MINKSKYDQNYLTTQNGCTIIDKSSERERGPASSILSQDPKSVWVTSDKLPQQCTISLKKIIKKPAFYNTVGIYCWHQYDSNPALIEIWGKSVPQLDKWHIITKIRLSLSDSWQYFKIQDLNADKIKQLKFKIIENFGDSKTYINKVALHYVNPASAVANTNKKQKQDKANIYLNNKDPNQLQMDSNRAGSDFKNVNSLQYNNGLVPRQKTYSQYYKPQQYNAHTQNIPNNRYSENRNPNTHNNNSIIQQLNKQLSKANSQILKLTQKQQLTEQTLYKQNKIIANMQLTIASLFKIVDGIQKVQKIQELAQLQNSHGNKITSNNKKMHKNGKSAYQIQQAEDEEIDEEDPHINQHQDSPTQIQMQNRLKYKNGNKPTNSIGKSNNKSKNKQQIQQLKRMLNNLQKQSIAANSKQKGKGPQSQSKQTNPRQKQKSRQSDKYKISVHKQSHEKSRQRDKSGSGGYNYQTDVIKTNTQDDLSEYEANHYRTSLTQYNGPKNKDSQSKISLKGDKAKMLQRLVKLIKLKQMKKQELKKSGTKSKGRRQKQSMFDDNQYQYADHYGRNQYGNEYNQESDQYS